MDQFALQAVLDIPGVVECQEAGVYIVVVVQPGAIRNIPDMIGKHPTLIIDEGSACHIGNYITLPMQKMR